MLGNCLNVHSASKYKVNLLHWHKSFSHIINCVCVLKGYSQIQVSYFYGISKLMSMKEAKIQNFSLFLNHSSLNPNFFRLFWFGVSELSTIMLIANVQLTSMLKIFLNLIINHRIGVSAKIYKSLHLCFRISFFFFLPLCTHSDYQYKITKI